MLDGHMDLALQAGVLNSVLLATLSDSAIIAIVGAMAVVVVGVIAAIPPSMLAYAALKQAKLNADAAAKANTATNLKIAETAAKVEVVGTTTTEIHQLTNSHLSEITSQLKVAMEKISGLEQTALAIAKERLVSDKARAEVRAHRRRK